jgi:hypothetical protein
MSEIETKWNSDKKHLPLDQRHFHLYCLLHKRSMERINTYPNLVSPSTFNDYVNWCKLFDQCQEAIVACDKARLREYASNFRLQNHVLKQQFVTSDLESIDKRQIKYPCVIKCSHDSGSARFINKSSEIVGVIPHFKDRMQRKYGVIGGEWQYSMMQPKIVIERNHNATGQPLPDYKFHCVSGKALFCQHIFDRGAHTKEINVDLHGNDLGFLFDENFKKSDTFEMPNQYDEMIHIANLLSKPFKYARIDLYLVDKKVFIGEVTLHPRGGYYTGDGQVKIGKIMNFDDASYREPIWSA